MGQKVNPNIFRLGVNKTWNTAFFEKNDSELALYTFKNVELKNYIQKFLINNKLILHDHRLHYSQSVLNIFVSYFIPTTFKPKKKNYFNANNFNEIFLLNKFIEGLNRFNKKKYKIKIIFHCINKKIKSLTRKDVYRLKKDLVVLRRFKKDSFNFDETFNLLFNATLHKNSSFMLSNFIANKLKTIKKHNRFLKCVKKILLPLIKSNLSSMKGIRIEINGIINRAKRTKKKVITVGDMPIQSISTKLNYSQESKTHNPNGSLGVKVWVIDK